MLVFACNLTFCIVSDQVGKETDKLKEFLDGRFQTWLSHKYYFENRITVADVSIAVLLDGFYELFGKSYDKFVGRKHECLDTLYKEISDQARIKALLQKQAKLGF